jgi:hypothetical protein
VGVLIHARQSQVRRIDRSKTTTALKDRSACHRRLPTQQEVFELELVRGIGRLATAPLAATAQDDLPQRDPARTTRAIAPSLLPKGARKRRM